MLKIQAGAQPTPLSTSSIAMESVFESAVVVVAEFRLSWNMQLYAV